MMPYGSADLAQAYSRIAAVNGTTFILTPTIELTNIHIKDD